jgi:hypothetical protein
MFISNERNCVDWRNTLLGEGEALTRRPDGRPRPPLRDDCANLGRDQGMVRVLMEQGNDGKFTILWRDDNALKLYGSSFWSS